MDSKQAVLRDFTVGIVLKTENVNFAEIARQNPEAKKHRAVKIPNRRISGNPCSKTGA